MLKTAVVSGAACTMLFTALSAAPASATDLDRVQKICGQATVTAKLEQDGRDREVDVEVYSQARGEKWRLVVRDSNGNVLHRINRTTNRDAEFDVWRYVPLNANQIDVRVSGPSGQACSIRLKAD